jgi:hypothetical protein
MSGSPPVNLSVCLSVYLSVCLSVYLSVCLSVYLSVWLSVSVACCQFFFYLFPVYFTTCLYFCLLLYYTLRSRMKSSPGYATRTIQSYCKRIVCHITNDVTVVYLARDIMISMRANPLQWPSERVDPENQHFIGPWNGNERSKCHLGPKKSRFSGPTMSNGLSNEFSPIKIITSKRHIKKTGILVILSALFSLVAISGLKKVSIFRSLYNLRLKSEHHIGK